MKTKLFHSTRLFFTYSVLSFVGFFMSVSNSYSQDVHFSQFYMSPLLLNPAQAGAEYDMRGIINYRNQWNSVASPYVTGNLSWDMRVSKKKTKNGFSALGTDIFYDKAGVGEMKTFQINLTYAYHILLNSNSTLGLGVSGGFNQRSTNYTSFQWFNQYDGTSFNASLPTGEPTGSASSSYFDLGSGMHYEYGIDKNSNFGLSAGLGVFHLNRPGYSFYGTNEKLNLKTVGYVYALIGKNNNKISLLPGIVYSQQGTNTELLLGNMFCYEFTEASKITGYVKGSSLSIGGYYRNKDAIIASVLLQMGQYSIGISYDMNVSGLQAVSNGKGGFEISLRFVNPSPFLYSKARFL